MPFETNSVCLGIARILPRFGLVAFADSPRRVYDVANPSSMALFPCRNRLFPALNVPHICDNAKSRDGLDVLIDDGHAFVEVSVGKWSFGSQRRLLYAGRNQNPPPEFVGVITIAATLALATWQFRPLIWLFEIKMVSTESVALTANAIRSAIV